VVNLTEIIVVLCAYLLGSINGSLVLGRFKKVDIRAQGSGNAGGTNAFRTQGFKFALGVIIIDIGKAVLALYLIKHFAVDALSQNNQLIYLAAVAVVVGHCYPIWHGFKGGKGVATYAGVALIFIPSIFPWLLLLIFSILVLSGYVSLASIITSLSVPIIYALTSHDYFNDPLFWTFVVISLLIVFTHRGNIKKLLNGNENRFEKIRLLHRLINK